MQIVQKKNNTVLKQDNKANRHYENFTGIM